MRRMLLILLTAGIPFASAQAGVASGLTGNDTGGIISWSRENQCAARHLAAAHCGQYGKVARITSVIPRYGYYIGFACNFPRLRAARYRHVVRARY